ncbi:hypothetical protein [Thermincola ferriacetica]
MQRFFHFTITSDAKRQVPKMILERLADEYLWQEQEASNGPMSVKSRAARIKELIEKEVNRRSAQEEFNKILNEKRTNLAS